MRSSSTTLHPKKWCVLTFKMQETRFLLLSVKEKKNGRDCIKRTSKARWMFCYAAVVEREREKKEETRMVN